MRAFLVSAILLPVLPATASVGKTFAGAEDTTVYISSSSQRSALVAEAGTGTAIEAAGDPAVHARGSRTGLRAEAEYYAVEAVARNGVGVRAYGSGTGVTAEGGSSGLAAIGAGAGVVAAASEPGGTGVKASVELSRGIGVWGQAGLHGVPGRAAIGVAGYGMAEGSTGVSGMVDARHGVAVLGGAHHPEALAGYFQGDVVISGRCQPCVPADPERQKNFRRLEGALAKVLALNPGTFDAPEEEPGGRRLGFSAPELRSQVPEAVHLVTAPARATPAEQWNTLEQDSRTIQALDYQSLIPLLVRAIQEQQAEIDRLRRDAHGQKN